jgi:hypothetical protein
MPKRSPRRVAPLRTPDANDEAAAGPQADHRPRVRSIFDPSPSAAARAFTARRAAPREDYESDPRRKGSEAAAADEGREEPSA